MKLQLALDFVTNEQALALVAELKDVVDVFEIGTPLVVREGMALVRQVKCAHPQIVLLADLKIMDAGAHETRIALDAGADIVTVLGAADDATIAASVAEAHKAGKEILVDMIGVADASRVRRIDGLGADYICTHTAFDIQATGKNPLEELQAVKKIVRQAKIAVAGGIRLATIGAIAAEAPDLIIVGGGITGETNRKGAALQMRQIMQGE